MSSVPPPVPPRPDVPGAAPVDRWQVVSPGRMKATAIVRAGLRLWSRHWLRWGLVTVLFTGVPSVVVAAVYPTTGFPSSLADRSAEPNAFVILLILVTGLLLIPWLYVILTKAVLQATIEGEPRRPLIARTVRGVPSLLWIGLLLVLAVVAVAIPLVIPAALAHTESDAATLLLLLPLVFLVLFIWVGPRLIVLVEVFVGEDRRGTHAIGETWRRSKGAWGTALGVIVLNFLVVIGISLVPGVIAEAAFPLPTVGHAVPRAILSVLTGALTTPIGVAITAALYLELSARNGVLDRAALRRNLARFDPA